ncbi:MAG: O-antigen ligase family protein [Bacteroidetes bacterium]|nr:O-antigen ligase family protein [Bacteroidota bacterium]
MNQARKELFERSKIWVVYTLSILYIVLNTYLVRRELYYGMLIPVGIVLLYLYIFRLDIILLLIAFFTPLAINLTDLEFGFGISVPTEPLMFGVLVLFVLKLIYEKTFDRTMLKHPLTIIIILQLLWLLITSLTSQLPIVSLKFLLARLWFVIPFYFLAIYLFRKVNNIKSFLWLYTIPLIGVIVYTTYNHYLWGFDEQAGHWVMYPFYNDHTAYGAILTLFIPVFVGFTFSRIYSRFVRVFCLVVLMMLVLALILSFSRAAWVSLAFAFFVYLIVLLKIKFKWIVITLFILGGIFYLFQGEIWDKLERNKQGTSANFIEHVQSISNISTDASNLERINRWQSAFRMFNERPVFGFGPGTYQFEYGPYQRSMEKTKISTDFGDRGNAHSEYIGPLAESGFIGAIFVIIILICTVVTGFRVYRKAQTREIKVISLSVMLGLITYFFHGTMNNFLDSDKASVPFWGFIAILVAMDLYFTNGQSAENQETGVTGKQ